MNLQNKVSDNSEKFFTHRVTAVLAEILLSFVEVKLFDGRVVWLTKYFFIGQVVQLNITDYVLNYNANYRYNIGVG